MKDEDEIEVPTGMTDVTSAISVLHVISNMIGNPRNRGGNEILEKLRKLDFSDETSFYLLWYAFCVVYQEMEDVTNESYAALASAGVPLDEIFDHGDIYPALSEVFRTIMFIEEDYMFGEMKPQWKDHWKARYMKYWRRWLDTCDSSVPYYSNEHVEGDSNV